MTKEELKKGIKEEFKEHMLNILEDSSIIYNVPYNEILNICCEVLDELKILNKNKKLNTEINKYFEN